MRTVNVTSIKVACVGRWDNCLALKLYDQNCYVFTDISWRRAQGSKFVSNMKDKGRCRVIFVTNKQLIDPNCKQLNAYQKRAFKYIFDLAH